MIYDVNSHLFRSFLSQKGGGAADKRGVQPLVLHALADSTMRTSPKTEEQKPKEQRPKASENKPVMTE